VLHVVQAFDRKPVADVETDDEHAVEQKLAVAAEVFRDRQGWPKPHQRLDVLRRLAVAVEDKRDHFADLIAREGGKPLRDAVVEVDRAVDGIRNAADELRSFAGREIPMGLTAASAGRRAFTVKEPIGVVVAISAFNHPLNLIVHQVVPAIATGCPVIVKPAAETPLSCIEFVALVHKAGLDKAWCQTALLSETSVAEKLATDTRVAFFSFIGSARVGWHLHSKLAHGTRSALEHGGAAPAIIDRSANIDTIIAPLARGGYYHAGQVCVSTQRIFVHRDVRDEFIVRFVDTVAALRVGDPLLDDTEVGPLIRPRDADRTIALIQEATSKGATLAVGGNRLSSTTVSPAVLLDAPRDAKVSSEEIFGPVTCVNQYDDLDEAIEAANRIPFAFQASVFAQDIDVALSAADQLDASAVMVNDHTAFRTDWMPFAGRRLSGYGVGGIPSTMRDMTQEKMLVFKQAEPAVRSGSAAHPKEIIRAGVIAAKS
jgi:acyl-CoA reductase-like NAD-dependent aldehyde dehydrogenase